MVGFFSLTIWGWIRMLKLNTAYGDWLAIISGGVIGGYVISNYFFAGPHILTRRLDAVVAFFLILLFAYGLYSLIAVIKRQPMVRKFRSVPFIIHTGGILLLSVVVTAVYSLGPDTKTVSFSEYGLMQYIWEVESWYKKPRLPYCVLADTYPLLALEAISAKEIIGGNFPIDASFGQPELNRIYYNMLHDINITDPRDVQLLNDFIECWYIDPVKEWPGRFNQIAKFFDLSHDAEFKILGTLEANKFWK